jgi:heterodisulfide reductase subunit B
LITACPLCLYNLKENGTEAEKIPVYYFTELLAVALGLEELKEGGLARAC